MYCVFYRYVYHVVGKCRGCLLRFDIFEALHRWSEMLVCLFAVITLGVQPITVAAIPIALFDPVFIIFSCLELFRLLVHSETVTVIPFSASILTSTFSEV